MNNIFEKSLEYVKENIVNLFLYVLSFLVVNLPFQFLEDYLLPKQELFGLSIFINIITSIIAVLFSAEAYLAIREDRNLRYFGGIFILKEYGFDFVKLILLINIKVFLWSLLFVIPGIIKGIEYQRAVYLKVRNPELTNKECFEVAKEQMNGFKAQFFGLNFLVGILLTIALVVVLSTSYFTLTPLFMFLSVIIGWILIFTSAMIIYSIQGNFNVEMDKYYEQ